MRITQPHASLLEHRTDGGGANAELLADDSQRVAADVELSGLIDELWRQLLAGAQGGSSPSQVPDDGVPVRAELASQLVGRRAEAIELQHLAQLTRGQATGHPVVTGRYGADLR